jgi:hypothetical protein
MEATSERAYRMKAAGISLKKGAQGLSARCDHDFEA